MTALPDWDFTPTPVAARDARVREALYAYGEEKLDPLLRLVQDVRDRDDVADLAMAFAKIYRADTDASQGRELTQRRLAEDIERGQEQAAEEAQ
jgi:hypothetical protein